MKKFVIFFLALFLLMSSSKAIEVRVNFGKFNLPEEPVVVNSRILVPLKVIAEIFDAKVTWDPRQIVTIEHNGNEIVFPINSLVAVVNGEVKMLDSPAILKNSTTMVPLKFLEEYIDAKVEWHDSQAIVNIVLENEELIKRAETVSRSYAYRSLYPNALNKVVVVDAGHGGSEVGANYGGIYEKDLNLSIAQYVKSELEKNGVRVYMTRNSDTTTSLASRTSLANSINADLFVSVHNNAIVGRPNVHGTEVLYKDSKINRKGVTSKSLATTLQEKVSSLAGTYNKGIINRTNLYVLNRTNIPSVIVEVAYMTNSSDLKKLKDRSFHEEAGRAIATGVLESLQSMS